MDPDADGTRIDEHGADAAGPTCVTSLENLALLDVRWRRISLEAGVGARGLRALEQAGVNLWGGNQEGVWNIQHGALDPRAAPGREGRMSEVYVSVDIETDGPMPGRHSSLSLGAAAFTREGGEIGRFSVNLEALPGLAPDPRTMAWWATQPAAWSACRRAPEPPDVGMGRFVAWLRDLPGRPGVRGVPGGLPLSLRAALPCRIRG